MDTWDSFPSYPSKYRHHCAFFCPPPFTSDLLSAPFSLIFRRGWSKLSLEVPTLNFTIRSDSRFTFTNTFTSNGWNPSIDFPVTPFFHFSASQSTGITADLKFPTLLENLSLDRRGLSASLIRNSGPIHTKFEGSVGQNRFLHVQWITGDFGFGFVFASFSRTSEFGKLYCHWETASLAAEIAASCRRANAALAFGALGSISMRLPKARMVCSVSKDNCFLKSSLAIGVWHSFTKSWLKRVKGTIYIARLNERKKVLKAGINVIWINGIGIYGGIIGESWGATVKIPIKSGEVMKVMVMERTENRVGIRVEWRGSN
jgi:hypothetical protein